MDVFKEEKQALLKENRHTQGALEELRVVLETAEQAVLPVSLQGVLDAIETAVMAFEGVENAASDGG